jgi:hypothetical protein
LASLAQCHVGNGGHTSRFSCAAGRFLARLDLKGARDSPAASSKGPICLRLCDFSGNPRLDWWHLAPVNDEADLSLTGRDRRKTREPRERFKEAINVFEPLRIAGGWGRRRSPVSEELRLRWGRTVNVAENGASHHADTVVEGVRIELPVDLSKNSVRDRGCTSVLKRPSTGQFIASSVDGDSFVCCLSAFPREARKGVS